MSKKLILTPGYLYKEGSFGVGPNHLEWLSQFGNVRILMPWEKKVECDLLYLPGGADLNPNSFGEIPGYKTGNSDVHKQYFYDNNLKFYIDNKIPIFGCCLGFQMLGAYFGSGLKQNLIYHPSSPDRWQKGHTVKLYEDDGSFIKTKNKKNEVVDYEMPVNSHHHQGILLENLAPCLRPLAIYDEVEEEIVVESFKHKELPIAACQWHSEEFYDDFTKQLVISILNE